jgi:hypothetical protein
MRKIAVLILFRANKALGLIFLLLFAGVIGCAHAQPIDEWALAYSAVDSAKQVQAHRYAPGLWFKAEESYKSAQELFDERAYRESEQEFVRARNFAERAENITRIKRYQSGEAL